VTVNSVNSIPTYFVFVGFLWCILWGCGEKKAPTHENPRIEISLGLQGELEGEAAFATIRKRIEGGLEKGGMSAVGGPGAMRLHMQVSTRSGQGEGGVIAIARLDLKPVPAEVSVAATGALSQGRTLDALAVETVGEAVSAILSEYRLSGGDGATLLRAVNDPEPDVQIFAMRLLAERKEKAAVEPIARLLTDPKREVVDAAVGALAMLKDERAVDPLIHAIDPADPSTILRTVDALAEIGGDKAKAYLEMLAGGHELKEIRDAAMAARKRIEERQGRPPSQSKI